MSFEFHLQILVLHWEDVLGCFAAHFECNVEHSRASHSTLFFVNFRFIVVLQFSCHGVLVLE